MIGEFLSKTLKAVTIPVDIAEAAFDCLTGGDGRKASRDQMKESMPCVSNLRDAVCDVLEELDD